jgi:hypothetical protein
LDAAPSSEAKPNPESFMKMFPKEIILNLAVLLLAVVTASAQVPQGELRDVVKVGVPTLRFVRSLYRVGDLIGNNHAQFHGNVVSREHLLACDCQKRLACVLRA